MKIKKTLILLAVMLIGMVGYSQVNVAVENLVNTPYEVNAIYSNGSNIITKVTDLDVAGTAGASITLDYADPNNPGYYLHHWKIYTTNCQPTLVAQHAYSTSGLNQITHCNQCNNTAYSYYNQSIHKDIIGCRN